MSGSIRVADFRTYLLEVAFGPTCDFGARTEKEDRLRTPGDFLYARRTMTEGALTRIFGSTDSVGTTDMKRSLAALVLFAGLVAGQSQEALAQDALGGALLGGAAGAIIGGAATGQAGGAVAGGIIGGALGAAIASEGQARPGGYRFYQNACYMRRPDGTWVAVAPGYCGPARPVAVAPVRDELSDRMMDLRMRCEDGDRRACVRLGIIIGENRERRAAWRREHPEVFFYER
jgi:hypothetical protein